MSVIDKMLMKDDQEEADQTGVVPDAASPLAGNRALSASADFNSKFGGGQGGGIGTQAGYGDFLTKFKEQYRPPMYRSRPTAGMPNFRGGFQRGWGQVQENVGAPPQYGTTPQQPQGAALQRFRGVYG